MCRDAADQEDRTKHVQEPQDGHHPSSITVTARL